MNDFALRFSGLIISAGLVASTYLSTARPLMDASSSAKPDAKPECDAHLDATDNKIVVVVLDLSKLSKALIAKNVKVNVAFRNADSGKEIDKSFTFAQGDKYLRAGKKYFV